MQVAKLNGADPMLKWKIIFAVSLQVLLSWIVSGMSWGWTMVLAYTVGGVINHSMTLAMHEVSHGLAFATPIINKWFGMFTNLPLGLPAFM